MNSKLKTISIALATLMASSEVFAAQPNPGPQPVTVTNTTANPVPTAPTGTQTVSGTVSITGTPSVSVSGNVGITGTPTVNVANSITPSQLVVGQVEPVQFLDCPNGVPGWLRPNLPPPVGSSFLVVNRISMNVYSGAQAAGVVGVFQVKKVSGVEALDLTIDQHWGTLDANGILSHEFIFPTGVSINGNEALCVQTQVNFAPIVDTTANATVFGYYTAQ
jgi:hypothetical protein